MDHHPEHRELVPYPSYAPPPTRNRNYPANVYSNPESFSQEDSSEDSSGLIEYWRMLRRRRGTLLLFVFFGLVAAFLITLPQTPLYRARTALEIQNMNGDFLNAKQVSPVSDDGGANVLTDVQTQMKIVQSENLVDRVVDKMKAEGKLQPRAGSESRFAPFRKVLNLPATPPADADYIFRQKAMRSLTVKQSGQTRVLEILFESSDPQLAADFLNTLTAQYIESNMEARWKMSERTGEWLSRQLDEMRIKLERSESSLQEYAQRSGLLFTSPASGYSEKTNVSEQKLHDVQEELSKASADRASSQSRYEIAKSASPDAIADVLNDLSLRDLQTKLTELKRQEAELTIIYTAKHEKVRRVQAQIAPLQAEFDHQRSAIVERIRNDYDTALRREKLLKSDYTSQSLIVTDQAGKSIQYNILKRDVDSNRQLYESMLQQVKEASIASAIRASNIRIVDPAKIPKRPFSPSMPVNSALGLFSGLFLGIAFVLVSERADRTLQEPGDAQYWTNLPELGVIPNAQISSRERAYGRTLPESDDADAGPGLRQIGRNQNPVEIISWKNKPSMVAEAFRTVLTSILFIGENGNRPKVLVLTSAGPGDGKTTVVSNLGIAMAEIRRKVLIIDADLRRPRMHDLFGLPNDLGLSTILREKSLDRFDLQDVIHETSVPGLFILPSGPPTASAANLLYSPNMAEILEKFKKEFDLVLIDTPPMLQMTDARVVGRLADAVIFVARIGQTTRDAAIAACQRFSEDRIRMIGTVLNDWNPKKSRNGYYGHYKGGYYSGSSYRSYGPSEVAER